MRRALLVAVLLVVISPGRARAGDPVGLVAFHGTDDAVRDHVQDRARDAGLAWIDLSPAPPPAPAAAASLRAAEDAYAELRWDDALAALDAAIDEAWRTGGADLGTTELSDAFLYRGLVATQRGDTTGAWDDLVRAAVIAPARTLDPLRFPTRAVEQFDRARAAVGQLAHAKLAVDAPGCDVVIDGGIDTTADVPLGEHVVRVLCPEHPPWGERVAVSADVTITPPTDDADAPPSDDALAQLARDHGVVAVLAIVVREGIAAVKIVSAQGEVTAIASGRADELDAAIDRVLVPPPVIVQPTKRPWWKSPWLWGAVGATVAAAVLIPFTIDGDNDNGDLTLRPVGWSW